MRFRERFEALIRKGSWCCRVKKEEKSRRVLRLHFLLSTFALGQSCRHLTDRTSRPQRSVPGSIHVKVLARILKSSVKLEECHIRIQMLIEVRCKLTKEIPKCVYLGAFPL
jgi:hypothetical protein